MGDGRITLIELDSIDDGQFDDGIVLMSGVKARRMTKRRVILTFISSRRDVCANLPTYTYLYIARKGQIQIERSYENLSSLIIIYDISMTMPASVD